MRTGIEAPDRDDPELNQWLSDVAKRLGTPERHLAHRALRAVLHALRDRMGADNTATFAAQLPPLVRAMFFEGYKPGVVPMRESSRGAFLEQVHIEGVQPLDILELEHATKSVLAVIGDRMDSTMMERVTSRFPDEFSDLWPETPVEWDARGARYAPQSGAPRPDREARSPRVAPKAPYRGAGRG